MLELSILGGFEVRSGPGEPIALPTRKARALLAYLTLNPDEAVSRSSLATLLWSDRGEPQANNSLSQAVSAIRKALAGVTPSPLIVEPDSLKIEGSAVAVDALAFDALSRSDNLEDLDRAESLYRGELLEGIGVRDPAFEDWLEFERRRLHALAVEALTKLLELRRDERQRRELVATAERLLKLDALQEAAHRALMRCYAEQGQIGLALAQYETCAEVLKRELGVEPDGDTKRVRETIIGQRPASPAAPISPENSVGVEPETAPPGVKPSDAGVGIDLSLPDNPSIAVLPFANMSGDPEQEFFADGIAEDIITALSKVNNLLVIARNSTFTYKGQAIDVKQVSREQGVRYVLEGSVRTATNRVRVTAQLIDATTGHQIWAERYDRDLDDIFAVQDEITREVVVALDVRLRAGEQARFWSGGTKNLEAWECVRLAIDKKNRTTPESQRESQPLCKKALDLDPNYAMAWVILGWAYINEFDVGVGYGTEEDRAAALDSALDCAKKALELDSSCAEAYALSGMCQLLKGEHDQAIAMSEKAVMLSPNHAENLAVSAIVQIKSGRSERALELIRKAMRLCPIYPGWFLWVLGTAYRLTGQTHSAIGAFEAAINRSPEFLALQVGLASILGELDRAEDAKKPVSEILRLNPDFSTKTYVRELSYRNPADLERFEEGLRKAGLPE